jgi:hypothetical protein
MAVDKKRTQAVRAAVIGLMGTILTVCGGLTGAVITAGVTVYQVERQRKHLAVAAPSVDQALTVDLGQIAIEPRETAQLDPGEYDVDSDQGFVLAQPDAGWSQIEMTYLDLFLVEGEALSPLILLSAGVGSAWDEQSVHRIRYDEPVQVQYTEESTENGVPMDMDTLRDLTGTDTFSHHSQIIVLAVEKQVAADLTLAEIALAWGTLHQGGVNRIVASKDSQYVLMQATWQFEDVRIGEQELDLPIERWALFAEGPQHHYLVELNYVPAPGQTMQMWEDLQAYMDSFRVIQ